MLVAVKDELIEQVVGPDQFEDVVGGQERDEAFLPTNTFSFTARPDFTVLFGIDDVQMWRYENSGTNLGTAWKEKNFDDNVWPAGLALLALEPDAVIEPIRTPLSLVGADGTTNITYYFRTHFNFTNNPAGARLRIRHIVDDGMVLYLNGAEVYRFGLAAGLTFSNLTRFAGHEGRDHYDGPFFISSQPCPGGQRSGGGSASGRLDQFGRGVWFGIAIGHVGCACKSGVHISDSIRPKHRARMDGHGYARIRRRSDRAMYG